MNDKDSDRDAPNLPPAIGQAPTAKLIKQPLPSDYSWQVTIPAGSYSAYAVLSRSDVSVKHAYRPYGWGRRLCSGPQPTSLTRTSVIQTLSRTLAHVTLHGCPHTAQRITAADDRTYCSMQAPRRKNDINDDLAIDTDKRCNSIEDANDRFSAEHDRCTYISSQALYTMPNSTVFLHREDQGGYVLILIRR